jgi:hypothetical protein
MIGPNRNKQPVESNRTSPYWGLLTIFVLVVLFYSLYISYNLVLIVFAIRDKF